MTGLTEGDGTGLIGGDTTGVLVPPVGPRGGEAVV
jgi:hypothetical protein